MSDPTPIGVAHARRAAAEITSQWRFPRGHDELNGMLAQAYAKGAADGYKEAADLATESYRNLVVLMSKEANESE